MADYALRGEGPAARSAVPGGESDRIGTRNPLKWILLVVVLAVLGELLYHLVIAEYIVISEVMIDSDGIVSEAELMELAGISAGSSYFSIDPGAVAARIEDHPALKSAAVRKLFPETLQVTVTARKPLVISFADVGDRQLPVAIDEEGVAFQSYRDIEEWSLPVISGIRFEDFSVGTRLPDRVVDVLRQIHSVRLDAPTLFDQLSEIHVSGATQNAVELVIYPLGYGVPVRIEDELDASLLRYIIMVLDMFEREDRLQNIRELDFRGGQIVFRAEEE